MRKKGRMQRRESRQRGKHAKQRVCTENHIAVNTRQKRADKRSVSPPGILPLSVRDQRRNQTRHPTMTNWQDSKDQWPLMKAGFPTSISWRLRRCGSTQNRLKSPGDRAHFTRFCLFSAFADFFIFYSGKRKFR